MTPLIVDVRTDGRSGRETIGDGDLAAMKAATFADRTVFLRFAATFEGEAMVVAWDSGGVAVRRRGRGPLEVLRRPGALHVPYVGLDSERVVDTLTGEILVRADVVWSLVADDIDDSLPRGV